MKRNIFREDDEHLSRTEVIDTGEVEIIEEFLDFPEANYLSEASNNLIRLDMNVIEYPLFSKNRKRKPNQVLIYYFNQRKDKYIEVRPASGDSIPGEFEEKVFIALTKIMRDRKYSSEFVVSATEILDNLNLKSEGTKRSLFEQVKKAMVRLTQTSYTFKNTLYSNQMSSVIEDAVLTNIMNIRILTKKNSRGTERDYFEDGRVKEVYKISLSPHFYDNILKKGYLVYNSELLLNMESSITRSVYMLINKWRFNELYLKEKIVVIMKRIPLKYEKTGFTRSAKTLLKSCEELKVKGLIKSYNLIKENTWENAEIEFFFNEIHNEIKQNNFYSDRNQFEGLIISETHENPLHDEEYAVTSEIIAEIYSILPPAAKTIKTLKKAVSDSIAQYGIKKVKEAALYTAKQKPRNIKSYFLRALEENWAEGNIETEAQKSKESQAVLEVRDEELEKIKDMYSALNENEKKKLEEEAYQDFVKKSGDPKIAELTFRHGKLQIVSEYLKEKGYFQEDGIPREDFEKQEPEVKEKSKISMKEVIDAQINVYADVFGLGEDEKFELKFEVANILIKEKIQDSVTEDKLKEIIKQVLKNLK